MTLPRLPLRSTAGDVAAALRRFEAARLPENRKIIERARHLGAYLQATQTVEERARSARHSIPEAVLAETAVIDFLYCLKLRPAWRRA